jgi:hypothetical protein
MSAALEIDSSRTERHEIDGHDVWSFRIGFINSTRT